MRSTDSPPPPPSSMRVDFVTTTSACVGVSVLSAVAFTIFIFCLHRLIAPSAYRDGLYSWIIVFTVPFGGAIGFTGYLATRKSRVALWSAVILSLLILEQSAALYKADKIALPSLAFCVICFSASILVAAGSKLLHKRH